MARMLSKRKRPSREKHVLREIKKIEEEVFDRDTMLVLGDFLNRKIIKSLDYPISTGKEANVFRATTGEEYGDKGEYLAIKIYRIETSNFTHMQNYITGDPRFFGIKKIKKYIVYAWAQKEFKNLRICAEAGVPAPEPYIFKKNVLAMKFLGEEGISDSLLVDIGSEKPEEDCNKILGYIKKLYKHNLVHADISEFNIMMHRDEPYLIDIGQGVLLEHPKAEEFLRRDIGNVVRYFGKYGVERNVDEVVEWVKSK
jgi:RIO kinase 1